MVFSFNPGSGLKPDIIRYCAAPLLCESLGVCDISAGFCFDELTNILLYKRTTLRFAAMA
ncbi:MAG TPA: hypothetical protein VG274_08490 [Rhizomicrobium sp.]|jgi:hypothetical protein|nr:hypothetical protein [Rhizomicrobium sp.]